MDQRLLPAHLTMRTGKLESAKYCTDSFKNPQRQGSPPMKPAIRHTAALIVVGLFILTAMNPTSTPAQSPVRPEDRTATKPVYILPLQGPIDKSMLFIFRRAFKQIESETPAAVIIDMDTPGGGLAQTEEIINWIRSRDIPVYSYVNNDALSAGAIISLACDGIYMAPGSKIGSAMPMMMTPFSGPQELPEDVQEKMLSNVRSLVRGLAQENGHSEDVAEAMVDREKSVTFGKKTINESGELLNLTAEEAIEIIPPRTEPVLAKAIVKDIDALLEHEKLSDHPKTRFVETPSEKLARYLTMIGPLLLALGLLGAYIEFKTPGFGIPGLLGAGFLTLFFFGHLIAGLAGLEDVFLVVVGLGLLALELFVIPGFGIFGVLGMLAVMGGLVLSLFPRLPDNPNPIPDFEPTLLGEYLQSAMLRFVAAAALTWLGVWLLSKILPKTPLYHQLVHSTALSTGEGRSHPETESRSSLVGATGTALTPMHPSGTAKINGQRYDVVSSGDIIDKDAPIRVCSVSGNRIVVEENPE